MQFWHYILILFLVSAPSGATWLYLDSQRENELTGLFGNIKANVETMPVSVEPIANTPTAAQGVTSDDSMERFKKEIFNEILEPTADPAPIVLPPVEVAIPILIPEEEDSEEDVVAEP